jgi:hypothetical protein
MRAFRLLALAAALVLPAAAAHAQYGVYAAPTPGYVVAGYGWVPGHWIYNGYGRVWVPAHRVGGFDRGFYGREHRWDRDRGWRHDRRW